MNKIKLITVTLIFATLSHVNVSNADKILYSRSHGYTIESNNDRYKVKKGDTLYRIIRRELDVRENINNIAMKIVSQNPGSFPTGNKNLMLSGTFLDLNNLGESQSPMRNRNEIFSIR